MDINNEELMQKFVRTGMIMRHIDGEELYGKGHPHGHGHDRGHGHGEPGHGEGRCCQGRRGSDEERLEMHREGVSAEHPHAEGKGHPHGHEDHGAAHPHGEFAEHPHGHGHGHGPAHGGHGEGKRCGKKRRGQQRVIAMVAMKEGITQKDLAFLLGIRPQTLGEMLHRLEERGLVERKKSQADGRAIEVYLTDEGRTRAQEIAERRKLAAADLFAVLTDEEKQQLVDILDKLGAELDKRNLRHHGEVEKPQE